MTEQPLRIRLSPPKSRWYRSTGFDDMVEARSKLFEAKTKNKSK